MNKKVRFTSRRIAVIATLSALAMVGRILMQPFPNIQPVTAILIIITLTMSTLDGVIISAISILLSNIYLGMGPWTIFQILTYSILMLFTGGLFRRFYRPGSVTNRLAFALYAFILGMAYGFVISIFSVTLYKVPSFWAYYFQGLTFDLMHGAGNLVFYLILEPILQPLINK